MEFEEEARERRLWASVIIQALVDATANAKTSSAATYKRQALAWLTTEVGTTAQNFEEVCLAAEIEPSRVRNFIKSHDGSPLTLHVLSRLRDTKLKGS